MSLDIVDVQDESDLVLVDSQVAKAGNVISVQLGELEYSNQFGCDKKFFLESDLQFQNEAFKAYLVQRLTEHQVNVAKVLDTIETLFTQYTYYIGTNDGTMEGLIS